MHAACATVLLVVLASAHCGLSTGVSASAWDVEPRTAADVAAGTVVVKTSTGQLRGQLTSNGSVVQFLGVPFAQAPTGALRLRAPVPVSPWPGVRDALAPAPACPQLKVIGNVSTVRRWSEDCLFLDVYVPYPLPAPTALRPMATFIHGGAFFIGDDFHGGQLNGSHMAATHGVVVASVNYRLGVLGFLAHPALAREDTHGSTGALGIRDQRLAMQWLHDNAAAFGADASRALLFGQSAGAFSVCVHLSSPASAGLFSSVIMESGQCDSQQFFPDLAAAEGFGDAYTAAIGCNASAAGSDAAFLSCLRQLPVMDLLGSLPSWFSKSWPRESGPGVPPAVRPLLAPVMPWGPPVDGTAVGLLQRPLDRIRQGHFNGHAVVAGTNQNEGTIFLPLFPAVVPGVKYPLTAPNVPLFLRHLARNNDTQVAAILAAYNATEPATATPDDVTADIVRDACLVCPTRRLARAMAAHNTTMHLYRFTFVPPTLTGDLFKCYHAAELRYVWHTPTKAFNADELAVSALLEAYWTNAMHSGGDPNVGPAPVPVHWPQYNASHLALRLDTAAAVTANLQQAACDFWDTFPQSFC